MPLNKNIFEAPSLLEPKKEKRTQATKEKLEDTETDFLMKMIAQKLLGKEEEEAKPLKKSRNYSPEARLKMEERLAKLREKSLMTRKSKAEEKKNIKQIGTTPTPTPAPTPTLALTPTPTPAPTPTTTPVQDSKTLDDLKKAMLILNLQGQKIKELNGKLNETTLKATIKEAPKEPVKVPVKEPTPQVIPGKEWWRNF
jgi:hypothetical protein